MRDRLKGIYVLYHQHSSLLCIKLENKPVLPLCIKKQLAYSQWKASDGGKDTLELYNLDYIFAH